jgi:hypothetical protein
MLRHDATRAFGPRGRQALALSRLPGVRLKLRKRRSHAVMALEDAMLLVSGAEQP